MSDNVKVAVRVRPFNEREKKMGAKTCISMVKDIQQTIITNPEDGKEKKFTFDFSYDSFVPRDDPRYASQLVVWDDIGEGVLSNAWAGYNCSLFAYGQTGSGKSYSMMGYGEDVGIIPKACDELFKRIQSNTDEDVTYKVECSMMEIYMEKVRDLFNPGNKNALKVRDHKKRGTYVEGITQSAVASYPEVQTMMDVGTAARTVASTNMNATSSRAHTIFQLTLTQSRIFRDTGKATNKVAVLNLIDLAGSERAENTGATGDRLKEACAINQSLSCLGNVISALAANSGKPKKKHKLVPYRDSILTQLLKSSLGGNAKTIMIAAISPADVNYEETMSTLRYADRAKQIKNKAVVNEDPNEKLIKNLKGEIEELKRLLSAAGTGGGAGAGAGGGGFDSNVDVSSLLAEEREKMEKEKEEHMSRMLEQLAENERLLKEQSKTWEEKLADAHALSVKREAELSRMGVTLGSAADRAEIAKKAAVLPHFSNLHEDPAMTGCLKYVLDKELTKFGRSDADEGQDVCLAGLSIHKQHGVVRNVEGSLIVQALGAAKVFVNGEPIEAEREIHHGDRVIFGQNHVFRLVVPAEKDAAEADGTLDPEVEAIDWAFAIGEMNKAQMAALSAAERQMREQAEEETARMRARVTELEQIIDTERTSFEQEAAAKQTEFEAVQAELQKQIELRLAQTGGNQDDDKYKAIIEELRLLRTNHESDQQTLKSRAEELESTLRQQQAEQEGLMAAKEKRIREQAKLDEVMMTTIPLVSEVNAMSDEMYRPQKFELRLMANQAAARSTVRARREEYFDTLVDTELWVRVKLEDGSGPTALWHYDKFMNRLYLMREMYQAFVECGRDAYALTEYGYDATNDPFVDPPMAQIVGCASLYLDPLTYLLEITEAIPIIDYKGKEDGDLMVRVVPHTTPDPPSTDVGPSDGDVGGKLTVDSILSGEKTLSSMLGEKVFFTVYIDGCRGLPSKLSTGAYALFRWYNTDDVTYTNECAFKTINPQLGFHSTFSVVVTDQFLQFVATEAIDFEVYAGHDAPDAIPASSSLTYRAEDEADEEVVDTNAALLAARTDAEEFKTALTKAEEAVVAERAGREYAEAVRESLDASLREKTQQAERLAKEKADMEAAMAAALKAREGELAAEKARLAEVEKEKDRVAKEQADQLKTMAVQLQDLQASGQTKSKACVVM